MEKDNLIVVFFVCLLGIFSHLLSSLAEQVNGKAEEYENRRTPGTNMLGDNIINMIPTNKDVIKFG